MFRHFQVPIRQVFNYVKPQQQLKICEKWQQIVDQQIVTRKSAQIKNNNNNVIQTNKKSENAHIFQQQKTKTNYEL